MPLSDKSNHLSSDQHKNKTKQQNIWCEDCCKYISDKAKHFRSEIHTLRSENNRESYGEATQISQENASGITASLASHGVEITVNEKTCIKLRVNPNCTALENLGHHMNELLDKNYFPRYKYQLSYLAKFSKNINGEENVFHKWVKSDFNYNHTQDSIRAALHNTLMQKLVDGQLQGSVFVLNGIINLISEIFKVNDIQASSYIKLSEKYKNNKSLKNIKNDDQYCFLWCILAHLCPVEDHENRTSSYSMHFNKFYLEGLEFPMIVKHIPNFENLNNLNVNVFELTGTVLTPIHINKKSTYNHKLTCCYLKIIIAQ